MNCPACADEVKGERLGVLGHLTWYRCRDCGIEYHDDGLDEVHRFLIEDDADDFQADENRSIYEEGLAEARSLDN